MKNKRYSDEQIIRILGKDESGKTMADNIVEEHKISKENTN